MVKGCPKWKSHIKDQGTAEGDERNLPAASAERPEMGVKACKVAVRGGKKPGASGAVGTIHETVKLYVAEVAVSTVEKKLQEKSDEKWTRYFMMQETKIKNQEKKEERMVMATNTAGMSPNQKACFVSELRRI